MPSFTTLRSVFLHTVTCRSSVKTVLEHIRAIPKRKCSVVWSDVVPCVHMAIKSRTSTYANYVMQKLTLNTAHFKSIPLNAILAKEQILNRHMKMPFLVLVQVALKSIRPKRYSMLVGCHSCLTFALYWVFAHPDLRSWLILGPTTTKIEPFCHALYKF